VSLISAGTGPYASGLATASESGNDVFFTTSDELVKQDTDELIDIYDARVGGGFVPTQTAQPCEELSTCREAPPVAASSTSIPSSALLQATGNVESIPVVAASRPKTAAQIRAEHLRKALKLCKAKRNRHRRAVCEATARHRYGPRKAAKSQKGR
jgi:hypothetical protein